MIEWRPTRPNHGRARQAAAPPHSRCRIPPLVCLGRGIRQPSPAGNAAKRGRSRRRWMTSIPPPARAMPIRREQSFAKPCGGRRRGRPRGSRNKATLALEAVLEGAAEELTRMLIDQGLGGRRGSVALLPRSRLLPARRDRPVIFDLPPIETAGDLAKACAARSSPLAREGHPCRPDEAAAGHGLDNLRPRHGGDRD